MTNLTFRRFSLALLFLSHLYAGSLSVVVVGDIMMGTTYPNSNLPTDNGSNFFTNVDSILKHAHLSLGNLEGTLLTGGICTKTVKKGRTYAFRTPPDFAQNLTDAGFDFMNLANNHMNDFGPGGIESTIKALTDHGIHYGGPDGKTGIFDIEGIKVAIVCFATSPGTHTLFNINKAQHIVAEQARKHDIVIVSFHGGGEGINYLHTYNKTEYFMGASRGNVVQFSRAVIDSGADLVWGHGPHVPRAMELYKERLICYSLGNFCTWGFNLAGERGYAPIVKIVLDSAGIFMHGRIISAIQNPFLEIDARNNAAQLMKKLSSEDFSNSSPQITDEWLILPRRKAIEEEAEN